jgi:hypothetical protein
MPYGTWESVHDQNAQLAREVQWQASQLGLEVVHNKSSARVGPFDGYHRYLALTPGETPATIRAKRCVAWREARYSRYYDPSIIGEENALKNLLYDLVDIDNSR